MQSMTQDRIHIDLTNPHYLKWMTFLRQSEGWSPDQIADYQLGELQRVVQQAYKHTDGYRRLFDEAGVTPEIIRTLEDISQLPSIEKEVMRDRVEDFSTHDRAHADYVTTGGSTGIPFGFYRDKAAFGKELASKAYQYSRIGWQEGDPQLVLRGLPIDAPDHMKFEPQFNELRCSAYHLTPEWMEVYRQKSWEYQPRWLKCYPSTGYIFARYLKETGLPFPPLKGVLCASENLYDYQNTLLSEVFQCRVFSHYGHYEMAVLAGFCEREDTYHVLPQYGFAELVDHKGQPVTEPGQMGEIVGTSFIMSVTPFIRYRIGDYAIFKGWKCESCGRPYQVWESIKGRLQEFLLTSTGRYISMTAINMHDDIFDHIQQFQFHQRKEGAVTFKFIAKESCNGQIVEEMHRRLMVKLGEDIQLSMETVEKIPLTRRGKHRFLIQELEVAFGDA